jgi:hypothetical protein
MQAKIDSVLTSIKTGWPVCNKLRRQTGLEIVRSPALPPRMMKT